MCNYFIQATGPSSEGGDFGSVLISAYLVEVLIHNALNLENVNAKCRYRVFRVIEAIRNKFAVYVLFTSLQRGVFVGYLDFCQKDFPGLGHVHLGFDFFKSVSGVGPLELKIRHSFLSQAVSHFIKRWQSTSP